MAKYIFIDVIQFSRRSAEAQSDIVKSFNNIVYQVLEQNGVKKDNDNECILIPTGDGMCISLLSQDLPFDSHIQIALSILKEIDEYNKATEDETRQYQVRIGINQNTDILVIDINGRKNVAGAGINMASRIMDKADGGQILVSNAVHHELQPSEIYMGKFNKFHATGKHNIQFEVHQYALKDIQGLNVEIPTSFKIPESPIKVEEKFTQQIAYYFAYLIKYRTKLIEVKKSSGKKFYFKIVFWLSSIDKKTESESSEIDDPMFLSHNFGEATIEEQHEYYSKNDLLLQIAFEREINRHLKPYRTCLQFNGKSFLLE